MRISITLFVLLSSILIACTNKTNKLKQETEVTTTTTTYKDDCFSERKVTEQVTDLTVQVVEKSNRFYFVNENTHYEPCEMPVEYQEVGKRCVISGDVLEIFPYERRAGTPFVLKSVK